MTKQLIRVAAAVMITLLALVVLWQFHVAVIYVLISLTLAAALRPLANRLIGQGIVVCVAWILLYFLALGGLGWLLFLTGQTAVNEIQQVAHSMSLQDAWRLPTWLAGNSFPQPLVARLPPPSQLFEAITSGPSTTRAAGLSRLHTGLRRRCGCRAGHFVPVHLLEPQSNSF